MARLLIYTLVLDGMPYIERHLEQFNHLDGIDWEWNVVEGVALPLHCTQWCRWIKPRLSLDGTTQYLRSIASHPRVRIHQRESWAGKVEMVAEAMKAMTGDSIVMQVDSDEMWTAEKIRKAYDLMLQRRAGSALFTCRYFVGPDIAVVKRGGYGNKAGEWLRIWRMRPGMFFARHEPPVVAGLVGYRISPHETERAGLVFDHYAYATRKQLEFKEQYYGYRDAAAHWDRLQANTTWPCRLCDFFPWVTDRISMVEKVQP